MYMYIYNYKTRLTQSLESSRVLGPRNRVSGSGSLILFPDRTARSLFFYPFLWSHETGLPLDVLVDILYGPAVFAFPEIGLKDFTNLSSGEHKLRFKVLENVFINMGYLNLAMANVIEMNILFMRGLEHKPTDLS